MVLPLTYANEALRSVMVKGYPVSDPLVVREGQTLAKVELAPRRPVGPGDTLVLDEDELDELVRADEGRLVAVLPQRPPGSLAHGAPGGHVAREPVD